MNPYHNDTSKRDQIREMFNNIAPTYDLLNHLLSLGIDRRWRSRVVRHVGKSGAAHILDVATGTGDLALAIARKLSDCTVVGVDLSPEMIEVARDKVSKSSVADRIALQVADVECLPFDDSSFDAVTVAFGVRNFQNIALGLEQIKRVLRPGGTFIVLEFSIPRSKIFGSIYRFYFHRVLPMVGGWLSKDRKAYTYLPDSVDEFPAPARFLEIMREKGFGECRCESQFFGVAQIYIGVSK